MPHPLVAGSSRVRNGCPVLQGSGFRSWERLPKTDLSQNLVEEVGCLNTREQGRRGAKPWFREERAGRDEQGRKWLQTDGFFCINYCILNCRKILHSCLPVLAVVYKIGYSSNSHKKFGGTILEGHLYSIYGLDAGVRAKL
jgi:hypothetical protein